MCHWRNADIKSFQYESKCKVITKGVEEKSLCFSIYIL